MFSCCVLFLGGEVCMFVCLFGGEGAGGCMLSLIKTTRICLISTSCLLRKETVNKVIINNLTGSLDLL